MDHPKLIIYDFDGVMTDNTVNVMDSGHEFVVCNRDDGWAVEQIRGLGILQWVLSSEQSEVVRHRCEKLGLISHYGCKNKLAYLVQMCKEHNIDFTDVWYVGNGLNDLAVMIIVGFPIATANAHPAIKGIAEYETVKKGGEGVILEVYEHLLKPKEPSTVNARLRHVGLVTDDVRASLAVYNALGFTSCVECEENREFIGKISGWPLWKPQLFTYKLTNGSGDMIELLDYNMDGSGARIGARTELTDPGCAHFALTVSDLLVMKEKLEKLEGVFFLSDVQESPDGKVLVVFMKTPEGSFVELVEEIK